MLDGEDLLRRDPAARGRYAPLFELGARLLRFGLTLLPAGPIEYIGASPKVVTGAVLALFTMGTKTFRGIHHLCGNVLTEPAVMLLRPLTECWASLAYIVADPTKRAERADWYLIAEITEKYKWATEELQKAELSELIPPETLRDPNATLADARSRLIRREVIERGEPGAEGRAEMKLKQMLKRGQWTDIGNEEMYSVAERWASKDEQGAVTYATVFKMATGVLHARQPDMFMTSGADGTMSPNLQADPTYLPFALFMSNLFYSSILRAVNDVFSLRWEAPIKSFLHDLRKLTGAGKTDKGGYRGAGD